jgi:hypothetical protein
MKESIKSKPYFSPYSLNQLNLSTTQNSDNKNRGNSRVIKQLQASPATNMFFEKKTSINKITIPVTVQSAEKNWFNNYE